MPIAPADEDDDLPAREAHRREQARTDLRDSAFLSG
jgi:hypothetical protein